MITSLDILKNIALGILSAAPFGPVALLVINNTLKYNRTSGFLTGLGGSIVDTIYCTIALFALSLLGRFIQGNQHIISIVGGIIIITIGFLLAFKKEKKEEQTTVESAPGIKGTIKSTLIGLSNPGALIIGMSLIAMLRLGKMTETTTGTILFPICVFIGSGLYWLLASYLISLLRNRINFKAFKIINKVAGIGIAIFGAILILKGMKIL